MDKHDKYIKKLRKKLNKLKENDRGDYDWNIICITLKIIKSYTLGRIRKV
jgi:hypothetical protein